MSELKAAEIAATLIECPAYVTGDPDEDTMGVALNVDAGVEYQDGDAVVLVRYLPTEDGLPTEWAQPFWIDALRVPEASRWAL